MAHDVEAFVITCGARPSFQYALESAHEQVPEVPVTVIRDVAPMSAAFQRMLTDGHGLPYFVQIDDDMTLLDNTVSLLRADIDRAGPRTAICARWLYDPHVERPIVGVKLYRREAIEAVGGWRDTQACEMDQVDRLRKAGWRVYVPWTPDMTEMHPLVAGRHDPMFTPETAYERYRDLAMKCRRQGESMRWVHALPGLFLKRLRAQHSDVDLASLAGCVAGTVAPLGACDGEKDFVSCPWREEWRAVACLLGIS